MAVPWLHLQTVAAIYQCIGIALTAFGVAAIGDRARRAMDATAAVVAKTRSGVSVWTAGRREQLAVLWARITHKPRSVTVHAASAHVWIGTNEGVKVEVERPRVDRHTISDRDWLGYLDDQLASVFELLNAAEKRRSDDGEVVARRLGIQRDELRAEIVRETRNGWQLVAWGLGYTFIGVVLGAFV